MQTPEIKGIGGLRFELAFTALKAYDLKAGSLGPITPNEKDNYFLAAVKRSVNRLSLQYHTKGIVFLSLCQIGYLGY